MNRKEEIVENLICKALLIVDKVLDGLLDDLNISKTEKDKKPDPILIEAKDVDIDQHLCHYCYLVLIYQSLGR